MVEATRLEVEENNASGGPALVVGAGVSVGESVKRTGGRQQSLYPLHVIVESGIDRNAGRLTQMSKTHPVALDLSRMGDPGRIHREFLTDGDGARFLTHGTRMQTPQCSRVVNQCCMGSGTLFPQQSRGQTPVTEILQQEKPGGAVPRQQFWRNGRMEIELAEETERHQLPTEPLRCAVSDSLLGNEPVSPAPRSSQPKA